LVSTSSSTKPQSKLKRIESTLPPTVPNVTMRQMYLTPPSRQKPKSTTNPLSSSISSISSPSTTTSTSSSPKSSSHEELVKKVAESMKKVNEANKLMQQPFKKQDKRKILCKNLGCENWAEIECYVCKKTLYCNTHVIKKLDEHKIKTIKTCLKH